MIKIDETYSITADSNCYILQEKRIVEEGKEKGKEYFMNLGYYTTINDALKGLLKKEMRKYVAKDIVKTLKNAVDEFEKIEKRITETMKGI